MSPSDLQANVYLVHLSLAWCDLEGKDLANLANPNLRVLDLSYNHVQTLNTSVFVQCVNVHTLILSHNPLMTVYSVSPSPEQQALRRVDLSYTQLSTFSSKHWAMFPFLKLLNLSYVSTLNEISTDGLNRLPYLEEVDLSKSPLKLFPMDVFSGLSLLQKVSAENYKLCCQAVLPAHFDQQLCDASENELSSCEDLLRSGVYRVLTWVICVLCVTGNVFCLAFRAFIQKNAAKNAFNLFVTSLSLADLLMGVFTAIIGTADAMSRGQYLVFERDWVTSSACHAAGFLSLLSCEVSALTILLITLDRFIVLRFPFSTARFNKTSAWIVTVATWIAGLTLAAVPLLPVTSLWALYGQTGLCIPLPVVQQQTPGQEYSRGVLVFFNFGLFICVAAGQAFIYWSVQESGMSTKSTRKSRDLTVAKRLFTVALTDFLSCFPIGLCGILAWTGWPIPAEVNVAMAMIFVPINAALNPFLYTFNVIVEKRTKSQMERLLHKMATDMLTDM
jgi:hypothetical protein